MHFPATDTDRSQGCVPLKGQDWLYFGRAAQLRNERGGGGRTPHGVEVLLALGDLGVQGLRAREAASEGAAEGAELLRGLPHLRARAQPGVRAATDEAPHHNKIPHKTRPSDDNVPAMSIATLISTNTTRLS